jgi:flagellar L-ring protein FlgH
MTFAKCVQWVHFVKCVGSSIATAAVIGVSAPALAQLPGLPAAPENAAESTVRPSDKPERAIVVQSSGPIRGSLFRQAAMTPIAIGSDGQQVGASPVDFTAVAPAKPRKFQKNDLLTIIVAENSVTATTSDTKNQKKQDFDLALQQFLQLAHSASGTPTVGVVGQPSKLPEVKFKYDNSRDAQAEQNRSDTFTDRISASVVDVKPNGTMVIEAVRQITVDKEVQQYKMSGICRVEDVTGENTVLSTQLANLNLSKKTSGDVHDTVKSGWLNGMIDKFGAF